MTCKCGNFTRFIVISGKCSDMCFTKVEHIGYKEDGYAPHIPGLGGGDYITLNVCLNCGQLQEFRPLTDEDVRALLDIETVEHDETAEAIREFDVQHLLERFESSTQLRWTGDEVLEEVATICPQCDDLLEYFEGHRLLYREEIIAAILDLQKTHNLLQTRV